MKQILMEEMAARVCCPLVNAEKLRQYNIHEAPHGVYASPYFRCGLTLKEGRCAILRRQVHRVENKFGVDKDGIDLYGMVKTQPFRPRS